MHAFVMVRSVIAAAIVAAGSGPAHSDHRQWRIGTWAEAGAADNSLGDYYLAAQDHGPQWAAGLGLHWDSGLQVEIGHYHDLQAATTRVLTSDGVNPITEFYRFALDSTGLELGWTWPLGSSPWSVTAHGGIQRATLSTRYAERPQLRSHIQGRAFGVRMEYALDRRWRLGLGVQRFQLGPLQLDRTALRLSYSF